MRKCFLHIGMYKTGTTSLQAALSRRSDELQRHGFLYPRAGRGLLEAHHNISMECAGAHQFRSEYGTTEDLLNEIDGTRDHIILSSENFCLAAYEPKFRDFVTRLHLRGLEVFLVVYLRNQVDLARSAYFETLKHGQQRTLKQFLRDVLAEMPASRLPDPSSMHYDQRLDYLSEIKNARLLPFSYDEAGNPSVIPHFLRILGLTPQALGIDEGLRLNAATALEEEFKRFYENRIERPLNQTEVGLIERIFEDLNAEDVDLSVHTKNKIVSMCAESNNTLVAKYGIPNFRRMRAMEVPAVAKEKISLEDIFSAEAQYFVYDLARTSSGASRCRDELARLHQHILSRHQAFADALDRVTTFASSCVGPETQPAPFPRQFDRLVSRSPMSAAYNALIAEYETLARGYTDLLPIVTEREELLRAHNELMAERERLLSAHNGLIVERAGLLEAHNWLLTVRQRLLSAHDALKQQRYPRVASYWEWLRTKVTTKGAAGVLDDDVLLRGPHGVDSAWYRKTYPDIGSEMDPVDHYRQSGWREGRSPNQWFSTTWYLQNNPDVAAAQANPLLHFLRQGRGQGRTSAPHEFWSPLAWLAGAEGVDADWYRRTYRLERGTNAAAHYAERGWREGKDPNPDFSTAWYLGSNPDVAAAGANPLVHYLERGRAEGRNPKPAFLETLRVAGWWWKLAPIAAAIYATAYQLKVPLLSLTPLLLLAFTAVAVQAIYVSLINDLSDRSKDLASCKRNGLFGEASTTIAMMLACCIVPGALFAFYWRYDPFLLVLYVAGWMAFSAYSLPPLRLKVRGIWGVIADASGAHLLPALFGVVLVYRWQAVPIDPAWLIAIAVWSLCYGLRGILWHQLIDRDHDRTAGERTFAERHRLETLRRVARTSSCFPVRLLPCSACCG